MIATFLPIIISVLGLALFCVLVGRIHAASEAIKLKPHRSTAAGVADLLNAASVVDDGIIACKSGALMAAWIYEGDDLNSSTEEDTDRVASVINAALADMGNGWMIHVDAVRRESPTYIKQGLSHFPEPVSAAIDEERRRFFESQGTMYEGYFVLTVTWYPPQLAQAKFVELMFDDDAAPDTPKDYFSKLLEQFKKDIQTIEVRLSSALRMERLGSRAFIREDGSVAIYDDFLTHLQFCITGISQPMQLPAMPIHLDAVLGGQELYGGVIPKIGSHFIQVVSIEGFPLKSHAGILSILTDLDVDYRWSSRFIFLDRHSAISHMESFQRKWSQKQRGIMDAIFHANSEPDEDAVNMTKDSSAFMAEVQSGLVGAGYYTSVIVLMHDDRMDLEVKSLKVQKAIFNLGFAARIETVNTMDAWLGSIPGHGVENVRRPLLNTLNLAHLLPSSSIWTGCDFAPCPYYPPNSPALLYAVTTGYSPFRLNLHVRDLGHTIMFGPTGAGKSTALGTFILQFLRYQGMTVFAFDKGLSLYTLTKACKGQHYAIAADSDGLSFCPLQYLETPGDRAWAVEWLETVLALGDLHVSSEQRNEISQTLLNMSSTPSGRSLTDFSIAVQDTKIRESMEAYTVSGDMGFLLDAEQDGLSLEESLHLVTFEFSDLMDLGDKWSLPVMLYLFRRIEKALNGQPAVIVLDEAWSVLENKTFASKIRMWLKELRKRNCMVLMATQSLADLTNSPIVNDVIESTATKICLANTNARNSAETYQKLGLNLQQVEIVALATPKRDYYLMSDAGCRLFSLALQPLALAFVGASDRDTVNHVMELEKMWGEHWIETYLNERGLSLDDYKEAV